ncbi:MAG: DNA polymerase II, partial [Spirochaetales bacterium]|nr:DNA polymerase II [Spirochaetales bacterium]
MNSDLPETAEGCVVHAWYDGRRKLIQILGRLSDGRSFAVGLEPPAQAAGIDRAYEERFRELLAREAARSPGRKSGHVSDESIRLADRGFSLFDGRPCVSIETDDERGFERACALAKNNGIPVAGLSMKGAQAALVQLGIRYGLSVTGKCRTGRRVDAVFTDASIAPAHRSRAPLSVLSIDIETEEPSGKIRCVALAMRNPERKTLVFAGPDFTVPNAGTGETGENVEAGSASRDWIVVTPDERSLLLEVSRRIAYFDPDILTGWNVVDFDFLRLSAACARCGVPFDYGRSVEEGRYFPAEQSGGRMRSASVFLPGRQVLDGLRLVRTGWERYDSYSLESVAQKELGRGKTEAADGKNKLAELDRLYAEDPLSFCEYCMNDAVLVLDILDKKELIPHTIERAALTGAGLDKAWTSVASFERIYAEGLYARRIFPPEFEEGRKVSGAAGGTVLEPASGMFSNVAVFDFRSLYPSVMRTFNIDPHAYERALRLPRETGGSAESSAEHAADQTIAAPNGARFVRERGVLPELIDDWFGERIAAIERGDDGAAFVYKILMNSFYGVLGTPSCRYARTELAGAITSFGKMCLHFARDFFTERGYRVLYGDTDSVFVELERAGEAGGEASAETAGESAGEAPADTSVETAAQVRPHPAFEPERLERLADELNRELSVHIREKWNCESHIGIRFEKLYTRFFIPRLRSAEADGEDAGRGRAKGYAGMLAARDGAEAEVEIKGMEAARSDYVPLTRRFQRELLRRIFASDSTAEASAYIRSILEQLYGGELDGELVFKKRLARTPESYSANTPPHVRVAKALGWKNRRGTVEYLITLNGAEAAGRETAPIDYAW